MREGKKINVLTIFFIYKICVKIFLNFFLRAPLIEQKKKKKHYRHLNSAMKIQNINCMYKEQEKKSINLITK